MSGETGELRRILFISPVYPFPPDAGWKIRVSNLVASCSRDHEITLVTPPPPCGHTEVLFDLPRVRLHYVPRSAPARYDLIRYCAHLVRSRRLVGPSLSRELRAYEKVMGSLDLSEFDLIWIERIYLASLARGHEAKSIVDLDDVVSRKIWRELPATIDPFRAFALIPKLARNWFRDVLLTRRYLAIVVSSDDDNAHLRAYRLRNVRTVPNGVDLGKLRAPPDRPGASLRMVFVGNMGYPPNRDAVGFFADEVLPALRVRMSDVFLDVIGPGAGPALQERLAGAVRFRGFIDDLGQALSTYDMLVAPLRLGGGTKLKVLAAMGNGIPIVTTPVGAEGLGLVHGVSALIHTSGSEIADAVLALHHDPRLGWELANRAYEIAVQRFCWDSIRQATADWLRELSAVRG
jgi:glycosyltransferase involved in cell wall biosynthesis